MIHPADIPIVWHIVWDATATFVALIIISLLLDEAGFFHWAALHVVRWGGGRGRRLFPLVILLGAAIAAVFANDGAALLLTPIVLAILVRLDFVPAAALAFIIACGFVADSTSLPLVISNLVNIVSANYFDVGFGRYRGHLVPVDLVSLAATLAVLGWYFRKDLPASYDVVQLERPAEAIRDPLVFRAAFPLLGVLLVAYFVTAPFSVPVSVVTCAGALILLALARRGGTIAIRKVLTGAPWQIVWFSLGMYLVVYGLKNAGLTDHLAQGLAWLAHTNIWVATVGTGFAAAILSSIMNNMPSVLVGALSIQQTPDLSPVMRDLMVYANVIGCDLGPKVHPDRQSRYAALAPRARHQGPDHHLGPVHEGRAGHHPARPAGVAAGPRGLAPCPGLSLSRHTVPHREPRDVPDPRPARPRPPSGPRPSVRDQPPRAGPRAEGHPPRILLLHGSLRDVSYSRRCVEEAPACYASSGRSHASSTPLTCRSPTR